MPLWEHIPDGEPRVFEHNGEERIYVYGSHDTLKTTYCGLDYAVWSAPTDDMTDWRCDGVCYTSDNSDPLYAPDVVKKGDTYYLYAAHDGNGRIMVAESKSPTGPFVNAQRAGIGADPAVLVDDDGRVYAYWGFGECFAAELDNDMRTIKPGTLVKNIIPNCRETVFGNGKDTVDPEFGFYEAPSIRKIGNKYILVYSKRIDDDDNIKCLKAKTNGYLDYCYSDSPLSGWIHGGTIINNSGAMMIRRDGRRHRTYPTGNNHGGIMEVNGEWYVFYHRMCDNNEFCRQAMLEKIDVAFDRRGNVYIGKMEYNYNGIPTGCREAEMTSQGAVTSGLDGFDIIPAGLCCYLVAGDERGQKEAFENKGPYVKAVYNNEIFAPVTRLTNKSEVGYKYIELGMDEAKTVTLNIKPINKQGKVELRLDHPDAFPIAECTLDNDTVTAPLKQSVYGKHAIYFTFVSEDDEEICEFNWFTFDS